MPQSKRTAEIRLLVLVIIDLTDPALIPVPTAERRHPASLAEVVAEEVVSNLDSVSYVEMVIVSHL
jgi:hypothetical protein